MTQSLRISDLPKVTEVTLEDYLMINSGNKVTSIISADTYSKEIIKKIEEDGLFPINDIDGGVITPIVYDIIDGGTPTVAGAPVGVIFNGGTPVDPGFGPSADGGVIS